MVSPVASQGPGQSSLRYEPHIQGLRALAILLVIFSHAGFPGFAGGFTGVDIFFVISGYLITGLLLKEFATTGAINFLRFYARRFKRLLPALVFMLAGVSSLAWLLLSPLDQLPQTETAWYVPLWISNIFFSWTEFGYFDAGADSNLFLHTWSLAVEEQFYLLWPLLILAACREKADPAYLGKVLVITAIISFGICLYWTFQNRDLGFYLMPSRGWQFAAGGLCFLHLHQGFLAKLALEKSIVFIAAAAAIVATLLLLDGNESFPGFYALLPTSAAVLLLAGLQDGTSLPGRLFSSGPMLFTGNISYSLYLWHWPLFQLAQYLNLFNTPLEKFTVIALSFAIGAVSWYLVEQPIRKAAMPSTPKVLVPGIVVMVLMSFLSITWRGMAEKNLEAPELQEYYALRNQLSRIYGDGCDEWIYNDQVKICAYGNNNAANRALLLGDSVGLQWFDGFTTYFSEGDWQLLVITKSSCPIVDEEIFYARIGSIYDICSTWRQRVMEVIPQLDIDMLIYGNAGSYDFSEDQWTSGTVRLLSKMSETVDRIFIIRPTFALPFDGPGCLAQQAWQPQWISSIYSCERTIESDEGTDVLQWLASAASQFPNVSVLDFTEFYCPGNICSASQGDMAVYRDNQHLAPLFVQSLGNEIKNIIENELQ